MHVLEPLIPADSRSPSGEQLRLQIHRDLVGSSPSRGRALGRHSGADQAESAAGPSDQTPSEQAPQAYSEASTRFQEKNQELREPLRSLTYLMPSRTAKMMISPDNRISPRAIVVSIGPRKKNVRYLRQVLSIAHT